MRIAHIVALGGAVALAAIGGMAWLAVRDFEAYLQRGIPQPGGHLIETPIWNRTPTIEDWRRYRPAGGGEATVRCLVRANGTMGACRVVREVGLGAGEAALKIMPVFRMTPKDEDGRPVGEGFVEMGIVFSPE